MCPILGKFLDPLTEWLNKFPKDPRKTSLNSVAVFSWVIGDLDPLVIADGVVALDDEAAQVY
jgi:hypothetical protein